MATKVFTVEEIELDSGKKITIKPLKIKALRKFMAEIGELNKVQLEDDEDGTEALDIIVRAATLAVKSCNPDLGEDFDVEDEFDLPSLYKVVEVAGGIDLAGSANLTQVA